VPTQGHRTCSADRPNAAILIVLRRKKILDLRELRFKRRERF
jgi:hypothetical protein